MFELAGRVALVTGAGQGLGVGIATALATQGAAVAINDLHAERARHTADALTAQGYRATVAAFDVTDDEAVARGVAATAVELGPVDILVNNAGVPADLRLEPFLQTGPQDWRPYIDLNVFGAAQCARHVLPAMCERGWGRIVQISSDAGHLGIPLGISAYGGSKAGIEGLLRNVAAEVARQGVTVNIVALGMMDNVPAEVVPDLSARVPVGRLGAPADVGAAVAYLVSDEAAWVTGQTLHVNGGAHMA